MKESKSIFIAICTGVLVGLLLRITQLPPTIFNFAIEASNFIGATVFIGMLKMLMVPLILVSIVSGLTNLSSWSHVRSLGSTTMFYYFITTCIAVLIGLGLVLIIQPGKWEGAIQLSKTFAGQASLEAAPSNLSSPKNFLSDLVSTLLQNPFQALARGSALGVVGIALIIGLAAVALGEQAKPFVLFFQSANAIVMKIADWIMKVAPIGIGCLSISLVANHGANSFNALSGYIFTVLLGILLHILFLLSILYIWGQRSPIKFLKQMSPALALAFSSRSSAATLPVTRSCLEDKVRVSPKVSEFVTPIGATVNMDGTALYEGVAIIFLLQLFSGMPDVQAPSELMASALVFITAILASIGAAAIPNAGLVTMILVANAVGLPAHYIAILLPVDAFLDMFRTLTNVLGDSVGAVLVDSRVESNIS